MRLIDADALLEKFNRKADIWTALTDEDTAGDFALYCKLADAIEEMPTIGGWISVKEVANIIADLFGDGCACNSNDIDEWLPQYCEYTDTDCPHPPGVACWEQYLKHLDKKPNGGG